MSGLWAAFVLLIFTPVKYLQTNWWLHKVMRKGLLHGHHKLNRSLGDEAVENMLTVTHAIWAKLMPFQNRRWRFCGRDFLYWWLSSPFLTDLGTIRGSLRTKFKDCEQPAAVRGLVKPFLRAGLLNVNGGEWAKGRNMLDPVFPAEKLKGMVRTMVACSAGMLKKWEESIEGAGGASAEINVSYDLALLAVDIISRTAFGSSHEKGGNICDCLMELTGLFMSQSSPVIPPCSFFPTSLDKKFSLVNMHGHTCIGEIVQEGHNFVHAGNLRYGDEFLGVVMQSYDLLAGQIAPDTLQSLIDQCKNFYFAGADIMNSAMQGALMLLALHSEWKGNARSEVDEVTTGNTLIAEMLNKLEYPENKPSAFAPIAPRSKSTMNITFIRSPRRPIPYPCGLLSISHCKERLLFDLHFVLMCGKMTVSVSNPATPPFLSRLCFVSDRRGI